METLRYDLRLALRRLRKQPGFTVLAVLTLAFGLGANTAIFSLVRGTMRQELPVPRTAELLRLGDSDDCCVNSGMPDTWSLFSYPLYEHLRDTLPQFRSLAAFQAAAPALGVRRAGTEITESLPSAYVSGNYFTMFEVAPAAGRLLTAQDDLPGAAPAFVLSYRAWRQRFGGDPTVVGAAFLVAGKPMTLVGVTAESFFGDSVRPDPPAFWLPLAQEPMVRGATSILEVPDQNWLYAIGRAPGAKPDTIAAEATASLRRWLAAQAGLSKQEIEQIPRQTLRVAPAAGGVNRLSYVFARPLTVLFITAAAVLLIAVANLANLLLARSDPGQVAVQSALGAPAGRLVRQALTEGVLLAAFGGVLGLALANLATRALVAIAFPTGAYLPIDVTTTAPSVLLFSLALAVATGAVFSAAPAWAMARARPATALSGVGRGASTASFLPRRTLVVAQVALSVVLVAGAGLLSQSLRRLENQPLGFESEGRLIARIRLPAPPTDLDRLAALYGAMRARLAEIPGVVDVSYSLYSPMQGDNWSAPVSVEGVPADPEANASSSWNRIGPRYFETLGTRLLRGRTIEERDTAAAPRVAVVNEAFVRRFLPATDPLGRRVGIGGPEHAADFEIVGVSEDVKYTQAQEPTRPMLFLPVLQMAENLTVVERSVQLRSMGMGAVELHFAAGAARAGSLEPAIRRAFAAVDPDLAVQRVLALSDQVNANFVIQRLMARLTEAYGFLALALASLGLYAVTAHGVAQRTRDFGIRMALGADGGRVLRDVLGGALGQVAIGLGIGMVAALATTRYVATLLYGVGARDPGVLAATAIALLLTAALAALVPARRAARVEPARALRAE